MKKKSYNYKYIIGVIIGLLLVTGVSAASYLSSDIIYDSTNSSLSSGDVQGSIDDIADRINNANKPTECPEGYYCENLNKSANDLSLGDYVSYTPTVASYSTDTTKTGCSETIYPSELTLWRVLNKNSDGSVDIISEYASSTNVSFKGQAAYLNFVGYLNELAKQYETEGLTSGSRYFGYNGQTEYITDTSKFTSTAPWTSSTTNNSNEAQGGGDILYKKDYNQLLTVLGTTTAYKEGTVTVAWYWMASRYYYYGASSNFGWYGRYVGSTNEFGSTSIYRSNNNSEYCLGKSIRPIVTLKSGLNYYGLGTENNPVEIITN